MSGDTWDFISTQIKKNIQNERSILSQFPLEAASITAREIVLSLSADCSCKKAVAVAAANATAEPIPASAPASTKRPLGRHGNPSSAVGETKAELPAATDARLKRFTVNLNADTDLQWVMQIINYGLMMPPEHWDIVEHCVHLYCEWLGCLLPAADQKPNLPHALLTYPVVYAKRILFSLCRFFAHRGSQDFPSTGGDGTEVFQLMHEPPREPPDSGCAESVEEIFKSKALWSVTVRHAQAFYWLPKHIKSDHKGVCAKSGQPPDDTTVSPSAERKSVLWLANRSAHNRMSGQ
ncbi:unnamed protein product [Mesocestoides corti]|uniref:Ral GTPase-activating protein subunit beta n=1 Tax=Mesocestoides corti TaxID=53468 RepID=A0A0R3UM45_MESCO|nr:unnamed protein product [Mesocestoides corti]